MDKTGLIWKFTVNRKLTEAEKNQHLCLDRAAAEPDNMLSTIKMNSTYLECCDKFYFGKGEITGDGLIALIMLTCFLSIPVINIIANPPRSETAFAEWVSFSIFVYIAVILVMLYGWFTWTNKELFRYTHYPIRFNRKTRMVHVFRLDGTVMSESWDKLYFTVSSGEEYKESKEVYCHRLADDGETVLETFCLPSIACEVRPRKQWEFVRRYMETGPEAVLPYIDHVLDVEIGQPGKRESFAHGYKMFSTTASSIMFYLFFPMTLPCVIGRWIAMRTCKQPVWPPEIKAECVVEPDDPYLVDAQHLPEKVLQAQRFEQGDETTSTGNLPEETEHHPDRKSYKQVYVAILLCMTVVGIYAIAALLVQSPESYMRDLEARVEEARRNNWAGELERLFTEIVKIKPSAETYYNRGEHYDYLARRYWSSNDRMGFEYYTSLALDDYADAIDYRKNYTDVYRSRGLLYYEIQKDYPKAIEDFKKWIELDPDGPRKMCESDDCEVLKFLRENNLWHAESTRRQ